jgi:hypothetical protein
MVRISIPGFSRGAYQARALAGMMEKVCPCSEPDRITFLINIPEIDGTYSTWERRANPIVWLFHIFLLHLPTEVVVSAYELYSDQENSLAARFKKTFAREVRVHFMGIW